MFSKEPPFMGLFTEGIIRALQENNFLAFHPDWPIPEELVRLIQMCVNNSPKERPTFDLILQQLVIIGTQFPLLAEVVMAKRKQWDYSMLPDNVTDLALFQMEVFMKKRADLVQKKKLMEIQAQKLREKIAGLQEEENSLDERIDEISFRIDLEAAKGRPINV